MKQFVLLACCLCAFKGGWTQTPGHGRIDSLGKVLSVLRDDTARIRVILELSKAHESVDPHVGIGYAREALNIAEKTGSQKAIADSYDGLYRNTKALGDYNSALRHAQNALTIYETLADSAGIVRCYSNIAAAHWHMSQHAKALEYCFKTLNIVEAMEDSVRMAGIYNTVGLIYSDLKDTTKALPYFSRAISVYDHHKNHSDKATVMANVAMLNYNVGKFDEALLWYQRALAIFEKLGETMNVRRQLSTISAVYLKKGEHEKSLSHIRRALKISKDARDPNGLANDYLVLGATYYEMQAATQNKEAARQTLLLSKTYIDSAANYFRATRKLTGLQDTYDYLVYINEALGDYQSALSDHRNYILYRDSLRDEASRKQIEALGKQREEDLKQREIELQRLQLSKARQRQNFILAGFGGFILSGAGLGFLFVRRRQAVQQLTMNRIESKLLRSQLEPHFIFNALTSIQSYIREHPDVAEKYLVKFSRLMRQVLEKFQMDSVSLEEELAVLRDYLDLEAMRRNHSFHYVISVDEAIEQETVQVPPLLLQPVLENAIKHGAVGIDGKNTIRIDFRLRDNVLLCEVDNEVAEKKNEAASHHGRKSFGMQIVRDRLRLMSGKQKSKGFLNMLQGENNVKVQLGIPM